MPEPAAEHAFRRELTDLETASYCDFAEMNDAWHAAVDGLIEAWAPIQEAQRAYIVNAVREAVDADDIARLDDLVVPTTDAANLLFGRMQRYAQAAGAAQQREAEQQGIDIPGWSLDDEALTAAAIRDRLRQVASTTARLLGVNLVQSAVRRAVQLFGSGTGEEVAQQVDEHLAGLSDAPVRDAIGAAITTAQNDGRMAVLNVAPQARYVATEIHDKNTCGPCGDVDGMEYASLAEVRVAYPSGGYVNCEGGSRCRGTVVAVWPRGGEQQAAGMILAASAGTIQRSNHEGGGTMPYQVVQDHPNCAAESPWAVLKEATGELMGCHDSQAAAEQQRGALYAEEGDRMDDEHDDEEMPSLDYSGETAPWEGVLAVEGIVTGDGREFAEGALTWADLPVPLRWNIEDSHGGEARTKAVNVGNIQKIWRDGSKIMGSGLLDLSDDNGQRAYSKISGGFLRGVSIDADSIGDADVEMVWPEEASEGMGEEGDIFEMLFAQPEKMIFHAGRIRAATLVDIPAFAEAYVALMDETGAVVAGGTPVGEAALARFGAVAPHDTGTSDTEWDGPANEQRLPSPMSVETARNAYAWIDDSRIEEGQIVKDGCSFIHHEISADGRPGAANLTACSSGIGILNGARGGTNIPASDRQGVYDHLAAHLRDADREPPPLQAAAKTLTAAAVWQPPAEWFANPQLSLPTPITVTDDGRIYGHAAQWGSCHIGQEGACIKPPREEEHPYYRTGEVVCADGSRVAVGQITVGTGHAPLHLGAAPAAEHYDNTGAAVADVAVGNDQHGIWVAGFIRPGADPLRVYELQAAGQVSGDWRRIGGQLRLVGLLAVNVPGFPVPKMRARVASGQPQALVAAGRPTVGGGMSQVELERWATRVVMRMLSRQVHPGGR